jgi:ubiquinone biosynthesis protein UbiJ
MNAVSTLAPIISELGSRLMATDPTTLERLGELNGKVIALDFEGTGMSVYLLPSAGGIHLRETWDGEVDVHMIGKPTELIKMGMAGKTPVTPGRINMKIEGDLHVGQQFKKILDDMQIDWEELLAQHIGDTAAYHAGRAAREIGSRLRGALKTAAEGSSEYLRFETGVLPVDWRVREFLDDVDRLRQDVDRLEMRINRLRNAV